MPDLHRARRRSPLPTICPLSTRHRHSDRRLRARRVTNLSWTAGEQGSEVR